MDEDFLERFNNSFDSDNFKEAYLYIIKFFKLLEDIDKNIVILIQIINLLNQNRKKLIFNEKEKFLEESITEIYQRAEIIQDSKADHSNFFFKKQIKAKISREINKIILLLHKTSDIDLITDFLSYLFNNLQIDAKEHLLSVFKFYNNRQITNQHFRILVNSFFNNYPKESLDNIIEIITNLILDENTENLDQIIKNLFSILEEQCEIYPDLYFKEIEFFLRNIICSSELKLNIDLYCAQIVNKIVQNRTDLFILKFFDILKLFKEILSININNKKIIYYFETSLEMIYSHYSFKLFKLFKKDQKDIRFLLNLMDTKNDSINDIIFEFLIDYLNYIKVYLFEGKISKVLLNNYIEILEYCLGNDLLNEYFLLSIIDQIKLKKFEISESLKELNRIELEKYYKKLISELRSYISIIFDK